MARHHVNQTGVAKRAGISPPMVSAYKNGLSRPNPDTLRRIAEGFGEDYTSLREELYPPTDDDDAGLSRGPTTGQSAPGHQSGDHDLLTIRLACLAAAA